MNAFKRLLVLGMCAAVLASPLEASASADVKGGGALLTGAGTGGSGSSGSEGTEEVQPVTLEEAKTKAAAELKDYYGISKLNTYDPDTLKIIYDSFSGELENMTSTQGVEQLLASAKRQMDELTAKIKAREEFLKHVPEDGLEVADPDTGEMSHVWRPAKSCNESFAITFPK